MSDGNIGLEKCERRLVAFFDILGFSNSLKALPLEHIHRELAAFLDKANTTAFFSSENRPDGTSANVQNFEVSMVAFDSILLVSNAPEKTYSYANFIYSCIQLMKLASSHRLPLRGAIDLGDVIIDRNRGIVLSTRQPDLLEIEKRQEWAGCVVSKEAYEVCAAELFGETPALGPTTPIVQYDTPLKTSDGGICRVKNYVLNWITTLEPSVLKVTIDFLRGAKKQHTSEFFDYLKAQPGFTQYLDSSAAPVSEVRYLSCRLKLNFLFLDLNGVAVAPVNPFKISVSDGKVTGELLFEKGKITALPLKIN